jgi:UDP-N-acetyl-D-mannosaminuronate dehydrogenase
VSYSRKADADYVEADETMKVLVVGLGHAGSWLKTRIAKHHDVQWLDIKPRKIRQPIDVMHVCYPYSQRFISDTVNYIKRFEPDLTLIEATVTPGTTFDVWRAYVNLTGAAPLLCHSPIRGTSSNWWKFIKMIGPCNDAAASWAEEYYRSLRLKTMTLRSPLETELGKLLDTSIYALNIAFVQEISRICEKLHVDFSGSYEAFSKTFTLDPQYKIPRPVFYPGYIGKNCLIPNARLLRKVYRSKFIEAILESNRKRRQELSEEPK